MLVNGLSIHMAEGLSTDLLVGNPGLHATPQLRMEEEESLLVRMVPWASWLGVAAAGALPATLLTMLYQQRLLQ